MKPGVFSQLYIQLVFSPKYRESLFRKEHLEPLFGYVGQTINNLESKTILVNGVADHIHIFVGLNPKISISNLVRDIKRSSALWVNQQKWFRGSFAWQDGYGAFSYGQSQVKDVYNYIMGQEEHHKKFNFRSEYMGLLKAFEIEFRDEFLFEFF
jgi:REP element-mobilizing transposase RayT